MRIITTASVFTQPGSFSEADARIGEVCFAAKTGKTQREYIFPLAP
jgi:hypothetical protein